MENGSLKRITSYLILRLETLIAMKVSSSLKKFFSKMVAVWLPSSFSSIFQEIFIKHPLGADLGHSAEL
jgi:hypothetical protein